MSNSISKIKDVVYASGDTYIDKEGKEKRKFTNIGTVFVSDDGKESMKLEFLPMEYLQGKGFINIYPRKK